MWVESVLPEQIIVNLGIFALVITGYLVEKNYVSRPAIFANGIAINVHVYELTIAPDWLIVYANVGLVVSAIAIGSYVSEISLPTGFYDIIWLTYSSFVAGLIILLTLQPPIV